MRRKMIFGLFLFGIAFSVLGDEQAAQVTGTWQNAVASILVVLLPIVGSAIALLGTWVLHKLSQKLHLDSVAGAEQIANAAMHNGIHWAETWAAKNAGKPSGSEKMDQAVKYVELILGTPFVQSYGKEKLEKLAESLLAQNNLGPAAETTGKAGL